MHASLCVCRHGVYINVLAGGGGLIKRNLRRIMTNFILVTYFLPPGEKIKPTMLAKNRLFC